MQNKHDVILFLLNFFCDFKLKIKKAQEAYTWFKKTSQTKSGFFQIVPKACYQKPRF